MKFRFSLKTTLICGILIALMIRASFWQWSRHQQKVAFINELSQRLAAPIEEIEPHRNSANWDQLVHRRFQVRCRYDFEHEMILKNRRHEDRPGAFVITPCRFADGANAVLVSRGFIPFAFMDREKRRVLWRDPDAVFTGLVKPTMEKKLLSPNDPEPGEGRPWVDGWLRIDIANMQRQLPYPLLPVYLEVMGSSGDNPAVAQSKIVVTTSGRDDMFLLSEEKMIAGREQELIGEYPIPVYDAVVSSGRHLGYVFEWAAMALLTFCIGLVLQFRRPKAL